MDVEAVVSIFNALGLMALVTLAYGKLQRLPWPKWQRHVLAGGAFGLGGMMEMLDPVVLAPGVLFDNRNLFFSFAAVFLGPVGAAAALVIGVLTRVALGGSGAAMGAAGIVIATLVGLVWNSPKLRPSRFRLFTLFLFGLSVSLSLSTIAFLPGDMRNIAASQLVPWLVLFNIVGATVFGSLLESSRARARAERSLSEVAERDPLTSLRNRRGFDKAYGALRERKGQTSITVLMVDLDRFKSINDRWGHHAGDEVLCETARAIESVVRSGDAVARLGGEEFAVLLPDMKEEEARGVADRVRIAISQRVSPVSGGSISVTASVGGAHFVEMPEMADALKSADSQLYAAKNGGRNMVCFTTASRARSDLERSAA